ncbi:MAG: DUF433 domain-containing protein, partial [Proteobacteria bacterium]|nr:DUF433 domain-containing protein [Pseudomonadota bacterium]
RSHMANIEGFKFLVFDHDICHGAVRIDGTSTTALMIAQDISNGSSKESIKEAYVLSDEALNEIYRFIRLNHFEEITKGTA